MTNLERRIRLEELRQEYINGPRSKEAVTLEARALKVAIALADKNGQLRKR